MGRTEKARRSAASLGQFRERASRPRARYRWSPVHRGHRQRGVDARQELAVHSFHAGRGRGLTRLKVRGAFAGAVRLISNTGPKVQECTRLWREENRFYDVTGIPRDNLVVVRERADKAVVCRRLGVTHMVDDRIGFLSLLETVAFPYLFAHAEPPQVPPGMVWVAGWAEAEDRLCDDATRTAVWPRTGAGRLSGPTR